MPTTHSLGARIAALREEKKLSGRALARMAGISQGLISQLENGLVSTLSADNLSALARALGTTTEYLLHGGRGKHQSKGATFVHAWNQKELTGDLSWVQFFLIPAVRLRDAGLLRNGAPGNGVVDTERTIAVGADTVTRLALNPSRLLAVDAEGDAMAPKIQQGDALIVNLDDVYVIDGKIYLFMMGEQSRVSRLFQRPDGVVLIKPQNEAHPQLEVPAEQLRVIGRVAIIQSAA